jgi:maltooligosyltrehalose trehalohydrolase
MSAPEPLLAPFDDRAWTLPWSSEDLRFGGNGAAPPEPEGAWRVPGHAAMLLHPGGGSR